MSGIKWFIGLCLGLLLLGGVSEGRAQVRSYGKDQPLQIGRNFREGMTGKRKLLLGFDSRRSFINRRQIKILGLRLGVEYGERVRMGFGGYGLSSEYRQEFEVVNDSGFTVRKDFRLGFGFFTTFFEYVLFRSRRWEVAFPLHFGIGRAGFVGYDDDDLTRLILSGFGVNAQYKIFPFVGLYAGVGYRKVLYGNWAVESSLSNLYYTFGVKVFLGVIYRKVFKKEDRDHDF